MSTTGHRWSGHPGAYCLDCGVECAEEVCLGECDQGPDPEHPDRVCPKPEHHSGTCPEPGSNRCNPYVNPAAPDNRPVANLAAVAEKTDPWLTEPLDPETAALVQAIDRGEAELEDF